MKKWSIFVLVLLACLILGMQYFISKREKARVFMRPAPARKLSSGAALPAASDTSAARGDMRASYAASGGSANYGPLMLPQAAASYKGACPGASLAEIGNAHGRTWGYFARNAAFAPADTEKMYDYMGRYMACLSAARGNAGLCDMLPADAEHDGIRVSVEKSLAYKCRKKASPTLFYAYMAGKSKDVSACKATLADMPQEYRAKFPYAQFCDEAAGGMKNLSAFLLEHAPDMKPVVSRYLPVSQSSCGGNSDCLLVYREYQAIRSGSASSCPKGAGPFCEAYIRRSDRVCDDILKSMSAAYCSYADRVKKRTGGYIGMSEEEIKAEKKKREWLEAETEKQKKEAEARQKRINRKIKKRLQNK